MALAIHIEYKLRKSKALTLPTLFLLFLSFKFPCSSAQTWINSGYWYFRRGFPASDINSTLFTHLICAFAGLNSSTYQLSISSSDTQFFSNFTTTVKQKNPTVTTLISIGGDLVNSSTFSSMVSQSEFRKSFIDSSIETARSYGFSGFDFFWLSISTSSEIANMAILFDEWRLAIKLESRNSSVSRLILTMTVGFSPLLKNANYPIESIQKNLDWVHVIAYDYTVHPIRQNYTGAFAALYDPGSEVSTDYGINTWIDSGLSANKLVLGLPFYGYAWTLANPDDNSVGAPAKGPAFTNEGNMKYKDIKRYIQSYGAATEYNATYVMNYCVINGSSWIAYDDVEVVKIKVAYAKEKNLRGYNVWEVSYDDDWVLSLAAQEAGKDPRNKRHSLLVILLPTATTATLLLVFATRYLCKRARRNKGLMDAEKESQSLFKTTMAPAGYASGPNLLVFSLTDLVKATNNFSFENKLGEGGYGPVYKVE